MAEVEGKKTPFCVFIALFAVLFFVIFNYTLTLMAGVYIVGDLGGSNFTTTYTVAFYAIGNAIGVPLGKPFSDRLGKAKLLVICLILFTFFSWVCAEAPNFPFLIVFRFFQGLVSGPFYVLANRLFAILTPPNKKELFTSATITLFVATPVLGATWGGWIAYEFHWSWVFYFNIPFLLILIWVIDNKIEEDPPSTSKILLDWVGYFFYFVGILSLSTVLTIGQELDWFRSTLIIVLTTIGLICLGFFMLWNLNHPYPLFKFILLKNFCFNFALFNLAILFSAYFGMVILLSLWLKLYVQYTPIWIGVLLGTMAISAFLPVFLLEEKIGMTDCRLPLLIAILLLAISCFHTMLFNVEVNFGRIAFSRLLAGFGLSFFLPPIFRLCFRTFSEKETVHALVFFQVVRALSSGLGAALYTILWQRRQVFYRDRLGSQLTVFSHQTKDFFSQVKQIQLVGNEAPAQLEIFLDRQATSLALDDCFFLMGWIILALLFFVGYTLRLDKRHFFPERKIQKEVQ